MTRRSKFSYGPGDLKPEHPSRKATRAAMYRCRELREAIDWLGASLGPLSSREFEGSGNVALAVDEIERQVGRLNAIREQTAETHGFVVEEPEIIEELRRKGRGAVR